MRIILSSIFVSDQDKALKFYTEVLGFVKKTEFPAGKFRWLTVVSPENQDGTELVLEPNDNPASKEFQQALYKQGIPYTIFGVEDVQEEFERMKKLGVNFTMEPTRTGQLVLAIFDDTCGNLIQIAQKEKSL